MKKHLIAAAVAAAVAVPAMAQVTISGIADFSLENRNGGTTTLTSGQGGSMSTSGIRFSASEDLGGGLKAGFTLLKEFNTHTGADNLTGVFADQVFMTLSGGFGTVTAGKHGFAARNANGAGAAVGNVGLAGSVAGGGLRSLGDERNGSVSYATPSMAGFSAAVSMSQRSAARAAGGPASGDTAAGTGETTGLLVQYTAGPFTAAYSQLKADKDLAAKRTTSNLAANYNFGVARVGLIQLTDKPSDATPAVENKATVFNVSVPFGATSLIAAYHDYGGKVASGTAPSAKSMVVGAVYTLSKRTNVYAVYTSTDNNSAGQYSITTQGTPAAGVDPRTAAIGLRHSF